MYSTRGADAQSDAGHRTLKSGEVVDVMSSFFGGRVSRHISRERGSSFCHSAGGLDVVARFSSGLTELLDSFDIAICS